MVDYEMFYGCQYHNESLYNFSEILESCINASSSSFNGDIDEQLNYLKERKVTHEQLTNIVKDKYVVFYHSSDNFVFGIHKFIIQLKKCYPGLNGMMGAVRFKFDIIKDDYVFPLCHNDDEFKKKI